MPGQRIRLIVSIIAALLFAACAPVPPRDSTPEAPPPAEPRDPEPAPAVAPAADVDTRLASLALSRGEAEPAFDSGHSDYAATVGYLVSRVRIAAEAADPRAAISIANRPAMRGRATADLALAVGTNPVGITVTAPDGEPRTYMLTMERAGAGDVSRRAFLKASNSDSNDLFGYAVAGDGDTIAVGAYLEDSFAQGIDGDQGDNSADGSGAVYIFERRGSNWTQTTYIKGSNTRSGDQFGRALALSGNVLAVGAPFESEPADDGRPADARDSGAAYVFRRAGDGWVQEARLKAANAGAGDLFGAALAIDGDTLAVGAYLEDGRAGADGSDDSAPNSGAVYIFEHQDGAWSQRARLKAANARRDDRFGYSVAIEDGLLAVGAYLESGGGAGVGGAGSGPDVPNSGAVYVFARDAGDWHQEASIKADTPGSNDLFGAAVALSGDTLVVGAHLEDGGADNAGAVYVYGRDESGWSRQAYLKADDAALDDRFGRSVAIRGDLLAVGAYLRDRTATAPGEHDVVDSGAVYLFARDAGGRWSQAGRLEAANAGAGSMFGYGLALTEDTLVIGAPMEAGAGRGVDADPPPRDAPGAGAVYVFQ